MTIPSSLTEPGSAERRQDDAEYYRLILHVMIERGADMTGLLHQQATMHVTAVVRGDVPVTAKGKDYAGDFELISKAVRRCIMLAMKLDDWMLSRPRLPEADRVVARKQIIREVEDRIARRAEPGDRDGLEVELAERMETLDYDEDISGRPIDEVIAEICRDLGIEPAFNGPEWKRRTPEDIRRLCKLAAAGGGAAGWPNPSPAAGMPAGAWTVPPGAWNTS